MHTEQKRSVRNLSMSAAAAAAGLSAAAYAYGHNHIEVNEYRMALPRLPEGLDGLRVVHLSDLHDKKYFGGDMLLQAVRRARPDLIVATGDMTNSFDPLFYGEDVPFTRLVRALEGKVPVYYTLGNHEQTYMRRTQNPVPVGALAEAGITYVGRRGAVYRRGGDELLIRALEVPEWYFNFQGEPQTEPADAAHFSRLCAPSGGRCNLLLAHDPDHFTEYSRMDADAIFSGHIHGGSIRLPFVGGLFSPKRVLFPKYDAGVYICNGTPMLVSRGLGNSSIRVRIFDSPEIPVVTLTCQTAES